MTNKDYKNVTFTLLTFVYRLKCTTAQLLEQKIVDLKEPFTKCSSAVAIKIYQKSLFEF
jgi:hypothetical protein